MLGEEGAQNGTWYHATSGPTQNKPYKLEIQTKRLNSHGIETIHPITQIDPGNKNKLKASVQKTPPRFCQRWVVEVLRDLENKKLVPEGTSAGWYGAMEVDPYSSDGAPASQPGAAGPSSLQGAQTYDDMASGETHNTEAQAPQWVWDEQAQQYRYWSVNSGRWIWQTTGQ
ncbi:hypothetical protein PG993_005912 [Apiospora rasikravindrae]|uniref:Uncharacterized protein n=1 Tax=Apiospora rasikravindrae TaxID=990691 RepID=A0ABR1TA53_9PEZI